MVLVLALFGDFVLIHIGGSLWLSLIFISVYVVWCLNFLLNAPPSAHVVINRSIFHDLTVIIN